VTVADSDVAPQTTVEFYRVGQVLGKGAFGKVNLALHLLTQSMVAIKSINKTYFSEDS
jgi:serine/threonine protein kinase